MAAVCATIFINGSWPSLSNCFRHINSVCLKETRVHGLLLPHHGLTFPPHPLNRLGVCTCGRVNEVLAVVYSLVCVAEGGQGHICPPLIAIDDRSRSA